MTEKYLASLIGAKHPAYVSNDDAEQGIEADDIVTGYLLDNFGPSLDAMTDCQVADAIARSETLDDFDREFAKYLTA